MAKLEPQKWRNLLLSSVIEKSGRYLRPELRLQGAEGLPMSIAEFERLLRLPREQRSEAENMAFIEECQRRNVVGMVQHFERVAKGSAIAAVAAVAGAILYYKFL